MMKELDDFTVERLEELAKFEQWHETAALAKIALAVKTACPSHYVVTKQYTDVYGPDVEMSVYVTELEASKHKDDHGGEISPLYSAAPKGK